VEGNSNGVLPQLRIGDDVINPCWQDSDLRMTPIHGVEYIELFTATTFYGPDLEIIFHSPHPTTSIRVRNRSGGEDDDGYAVSEDALEEIDEEPMIERRVPYGQIQARDIEVSLAGSAPEEGLVVVFRSAIRDILTMARTYERIAFETQEYMVERH
jgi:hypothetical protein